MMASLLMAQAPPPLPGLTASMRSFAAHDAMMASYTDVMARACFMKSREEIASCKKALFRKEGLCIACQASCRGLTSYT